MQTNLSQQAKKLAVWKLQNGEVYPTDLVAAQAQGLLVNTSDVTYLNYLPSASPTNYCVSAQRADGTRYSVSSTGGAGTTAQGNYVELDGFTLFEGDQLYDFRDGSSNDWFWDGVEHASQSIGPGVVTP